MAKRLEDKITGTAKYKTILGTHKLSESEILELYRFDAEIGYNADRVNALVQFIKLEYTNWVEKWLLAKSYHTGTLEYLRLMYGADGDEKYYTLNKRKTRGFDHSPDIQLARARLSGEKSKGSKDHSIRSVGYWVKKGLSIEEAKEKVASIQRTNTLKRYIEKYGDSGEEKFKLRNTIWTEKMSDPAIGKNRSLGLARYIERYGEGLGEQKYLEMRSVRNKTTSMGRASQESIRAFTPIITLLDRNNINYYVGIEGNKEWFIYNKTHKKFFFYDLTIPTLSLIIEYHGEGFHPNTKWSTDKFNKWKQAITNKTAAEVLLETTLKNETAMNNGWTLFEVFSSEVEPLVQRIIHYINQLGYA